MMVGRKIQRKRVALKVLYTIIVIFSAIHNFKEMFLNKMIEDPKVYEKKKKENSFALIFPV